MSQAATIERAGEKVAGAAGTIGSGAMSVAGRGWEKTTSVIKTSEVSTILKCMSIFNAFNAIGVIAGGVIMFLSVPTCLDPCSTSSLVIIAFYTVVFGLLMLLFEGRLTARQGTRLRKNFGFMFTYVGRTFFLLFIATMLFSAWQDNYALNWVPVLVGVVTTLNGVFNFLVIWYHPEFRNARTDVMEQNLHMNQRGGAQATGASSAGALNQAEMGQVPTGAGYDDNPFNSAYTGTGTPNYPAFSTVQT